MDFAFDESQLAVRDLAKQCFARVPVDPERVAEAMRELGRAQLMGVALPAAAGGSDAGLVALCLLLEQAGQAANAAPLIPSLVLAGLPLAQCEAEFGRLSAVCAGQAVLCASYGVGAEPALHARRDGADYVLSGSESCVEALPLAGAAVIAARTDGGARALFCLDLQSRGACIEPQSVASGCALGQLVLSDVRLPAASLLCDPGRANALIEWTLDRAYLAQSAYELGLCQAALTLTASYASERKQFGRPIGTFQAVAQRVADAHIAVETMRLTVWRAAWLAERGEDARQAIAVARTLAARAGHEVVCAAQHIHGGMGFDRDYPLHRYFLLSKQNELRLGGHAFHLARLGRLIAA